MTELAKRLAPLQVRNASRLRMWLIGLGLALVRLFITCSCAVAPGAMARVVERALTSPRRYPATARERALMENAEPFALEVGGREIACWRWGSSDDPVALLMHGWEGRGSQLAAVAGPLVERGYQVVTFDAPAHGASAGQRVTVFDFAETMLALSRNLGAVDLVVAHSFGCTAATFAIQSGLSPRRVVFFAPQFSIAAGSRYYARLWGVRAHVLERTRVLMERRYGVRWAEVEMGQMAPLMSAELLVVHDELDPQVRHTDADALAHAWPRAQVLKTRGLGHQRVLRDHATVSAAVGFLTA